MGQFSTGVTEAARTSLMVQAQRAGPTPCLIWSTEHGGWWQPYRCGYTHDLESAGVYPLEEAIRISKNATAGQQPGDPLPEFPVRVKDILEINWRPDQ